MTDSEFEARATAARALAEQDLAAYKRSLTGWALLGYLVIFGALATIVAVLGGLVGLVGLAVFSTGLLLLLLKKKLLLLLLPALWVLLRALWIRIPAPTGYKLTRERVPQLFTEIDDLCHALKTTAVNRVLLTPELNVAVVQTPRLGIFGWQRNTLILGLELLLTLTPEQARAVIAHELGHLSGNHSAFHGWIYRVRESWHRIMIAFSEQDSIGSRIMARFFNCYAPRFAAQSYALAQLNEYEADAVAAELTTAKAAASALVNVHVTAPHVDEHYWSDFFRQADERPEPEHLPWTGLRTFVEQETSSGLEHRLELALETETSFHDTHPCLKDRLAALGQSPALLQASGASAARAWFGSAFDDIVADFDAAWEASNREPWNRRYQYVQESRGTLARLNTTAPEQLAIEDLWQRALLTEEFEPLEDAINACIDYRARAPEDPKGALLLGRNLFEAGDEKCLPLLEQAARKQTLAVDALRYGYWFCANHDRDSDAKAWLQSFEDAVDRQNRIEQERQQLTVEDSLRCTDLQAEAAQAIIERLRSSKHVKAAWLAEKVFRDNEDSYVGYAIAVKGKGLFLDEDQLLKTLQEHMQGIDCWIIPRVGEFKKLADHIRASGSKVI